MKTRSAIAYAVDEPLRVEEVELDDPKEGELLVRMVATGICHSDLNHLVGDQPAPFPVILGHEGAGIVEAVGPGVSSVATGDRVVLTFVPTCGHCRYCVSGRTHLCEMGRLIMRGTQMDGTYRVHDASGRDINQIYMISTWSEHTVVPEMSVVKVDGRVPLNRACLTACGVATGVGAVLNKARVTPGSEVLVIGCGGVGINVIQGARIAEAGTIIAVDTLDEKLELARRFGATHVVNATNENVVERVKELTNRAGVEFSFAVVATEATLSQAFAATAKGGVCTVVGLGPATVKSMPINPTALVLLEKTVQGTFYGTSNLRRDIPRYLDLAMAGKLDLDGLVTRTYTLDRINEAIADLEAGKNIRGVIEFA